MTRWSTSPPAAHGSRKRHRRHARRGRRQRGLPLETARRVSRNPLVRLMGWLTRPGITGRTAWVPTLPARFRPRHASPRKAWPVLPLDVPPELLTVPGIKRNRAVEEEAFAREPLELFHTVHAEAIEW